MAGVIAQKAQQLMAEAKLKEDSAADKAEDKSAGELEVTCPMCKAQFDVNAKTGKVTSD